MPDRPFLPTQNIDFKKFETDKEKVMGYERAFKRWACNNRMDVKNMLEIGVHYAGAIPLWLTLYPTANIHGIDNEYWCKEYFHSPEQDVYIHILDQGNVEHLKNFIEALNNVNIKFDVIVDDGGHKVSQQQLSLRYLWKTLSPGGLYVIEDLHTSRRTETDKNKEYFEVDSHDLTTLEVMERLRSRELCETKYIPENEMKEILDNLEFCEIDKGTGKFESEISFLKFK
jgi:hypothetical protein